MVSKLTNEDIAALLGVTGDSTKVTGKSLKGPSGFRFIKYDGLLYTVGELADEFAVLPNIVKSLVLRGATDEEVIKSLTAQQIYRTNLLDIEEDLC